ncbi:hypothetical protein MW887_010273 [Aspergillus wentii]|nr:hypothetical protein MW887_010273 [Aspergillus wentii]
MCQATGLACPGYSPQVKWPGDAANMKSPESVDRVFRRPLYQVVEQESMTRITVRSLGKQSVNAALDSLDHTRSGPGLFHGPFGVLDLMQDNRPPTPQHEALEHGHSPRREDVEDCLAAEIDLAGPEADLGYMPVNRQPLGLTPPATERTDEDEDIRPLQPRLSPTLSAPPPHPRLSPPDVPPQAPELLRHFKDHVISFSYPLRGNPNCPWHNIHLPTAMATYAELLVSQRASHTGLSLFHSLLAASCLHRSMRSRDSSDYDTLRASTQRIASQHLYVALEEEATGRNPVEYKELLMAILSMVFLEISSGLYNNAQKLLLEAECLIRRRGLPESRKSSRVRALHHVYTWTRIMSESTCGCALVSVCPARPSSSLLSDGASKRTLRSFRLSDAASLTDLDTRIEKNNAVGHQDIHLEVMGLWNDTLFPDMYGVPESLIGLLSQAIRLANEQELLYRDPVADPDLVVNLSKRTKTLEYQILSWDKRQPSLPFSPCSSGAESDSGSRLTACYNSFAMHQSLILFYYRRVHNVNAFILQETVQKAIRFIEQACSSNQKEEYNSSLIWPCFIAACEAIDSTLQARFLHWLYDMLDRTAVNTFATAAKVAQQVWKARQETEDYTISWFDVLGHDRCPIIVV